MCSFYQEITILIVFPNKMMKNAGAFMNVEEEKG